MIVSLFAGDKNPAFTYVKNTNDLVDFIYVVKCNKDLVTREQINDFIRARVTYEEFELAMKRYDSL